MLKLANGILLCLLAVCLLVGLANHAAGWGWFNHYADTAPAQTETEHDKRLRDAPERWRQFQSDRDRERQETRERLQDERIRKLERQAQD